MVSTRSWSTGTKSGTRGPRTGGDHDVVGRQLLDDAVGVDHDLVRTLELGPPVDHAHLLRRELGGDHLVQATLDRRDPLAQRLDVELALGLQAHRVRPTELDQLAAGGDQRLRRDAVPQVRGAAHDVALDQRDVGTQRGRDGSRTCCPRDHRPRSRHSASRAIQDPLRAAPSTGHPRNLIAMSQLRHDPLSGRDVIIAAARAARPTTFATGDEGASITECPFCPGEEAKTPPEVARAGGGERDQPGWQVRVLGRSEPRAGLSSSKDGWWLTSPLRHRARAAWRGHRPRSH